MSNNRETPADWEIQALRKLADRKLWPVDELPDQLDADTLRCLDDRGWVEARSVVMSNNQQYPGDPTPPSPWPQPWSSPVRQPGMIGRWESVLSQTRRDLRNHPSAIRVTEAGKATLFRQGPSTKSLKGKRKKAGRPLGTAREQKRDKKLYEGWCSWRDANHKPTYAEFTVSLYGTSKDTKLGEPYVRNACERYRKKLSSLRAHKRNKAK